MKIIRNHALLAYQELGIRAILLYPVLTEKAMRPVPISYEISGTNWSGRDPAWCKKVNS
ncbi:hypothetical protein [Filimonas effusa]|uniref:hypothetical protein n=1 Tax=Filimonas effusa TaxID=2508721 RepID=UPI0013E98331|nr:hypothetical protein [Filimonas effusa]